MTMKRMNSVVIANCTEICLNSAGIWGSLKVYNYILCHLGYSEAWQSLNDFFA
jgi:hypothetical protein